MPTPPRIEIDYEAWGFPPGAPVANGSGKLTTSWDEVLWAALTVGRPNRQYVFKYGKPSVYEAMFRASMLRMALEQKSPTAYRLRRTDAARNLDPSEKGAINYFLGLVINKLFADKLLGVPWMMHLDVWRSQLGAVLTGRSRPDLVGEMRGGQGWIAMECKGRLSKPDSDAKSKAKAQATRLRTIDGVAPQFHIGGIAYFQSDVMQFYWEDPDPEKPIKNPIDIKVSDDDWRYYYGPILDLVGVRSASASTVANELVIPVDELDLTIHIDIEVLKLIEAGAWTKARRVAESRSAKQPAQRGDGLRVTAGDSWFRPFHEPA